MFFFFNDTATTEIYTLSLPRRSSDLTSVTVVLWINPTPRIVADLLCQSVGKEDRKSTRLNSSHQIISYAVFCLKKKSVMATSTTFPCWRVPDSPSRSLLAGTHEWISN